MFSINTGDDMFKETIWSLGADFHCGSTTGLTLAPKNDIQRATLARYADAVAWLDCEPDVVLVNGDGWDGKDPKGKDVTNDDMVDQAMDCADLVVMQRPKKEVILVTGTRYHDQHKNQQFERVFAERVRTQMIEKYDRRIRISVRRKLKTMINSWFMLEARHNIGGSSIPHGRATAPLRSQAWNVLNAAISARESGKPVKWPDLLVFAHRHYYMAAENAWGDVVVLPSWQALGGVYGDEICDGHVDLGLIKLRVGATKETGWSRKKRLYQAGVVPRLEAR